MCSHELLSALQLRAYAESRGQPQKWDVHNKGFIWERESTSATDIWVVIATLALQILVQLYLIKNFVETVRQCLEQDTMWRLCVWSAGYVLFCGSIVFPAYYVVTLFQTWKIAISLVKIVSVAIVFVSSGCWAVVGWWNAHCFPPDYRWPFYHEVKCFCLFFGYVMCANMIALSAVPTLLLIMVFPLECISAIGLGCVGFLVIVMFFVIPRLMYYNQYSCFSIIYMSMFIIVIACVVAVYVSILFTGSGTNEYFQAFVSALGSVIVGYWVKKTFLDKNKGSKEKEICR